MKQEGHSMHATIPHHRKALALLLLAGTALASPAYAQQATPAPAADAAATPEPQEIVVTGNANREGQRKIDASYSISTASAAQIREVQPTSTADLLKIVPGVWVESSGGQAGANVFIRGFPRPATRPS
jgi:outer membrane cobalamin receptor